MAALRDHRAGRPERGRPSVLVERRFTAAQPNRLWVAHFTYVAPEGFVDVALVVDVFARAMSDPLSRSVLSRRKPASAAAD